MRVKGQEKELTLSYFSGEEEKISALEDSCHSFGSSSTVLKAAVPSKIKKVIIYSRLCCFKPVCLSSVYI